MSTASKRDFANLEQQKEDLLTDVASWPDAAQCFQLSSGSWSALQVLDHLIKVEELFVSDVRANLPGGHQIGMRDRFGALMVTTVMRSPMRVRVPASQASMMPGQGSDLASLGKRWIATREEIAAMLDRLSPEQLRMGLFRHPIAGWMTIPQAIALLQAHLRHHASQFRRLKRASALV